MNKYAITFEGPDEDVASAMAVFVEDKPSLLTEATHLEVVSATIVNSSAVPNAQIGKVVFTTEEMVEEYTVQSFNTQFETLRVTFSGLDSEDESDD